MKIKVLVFMLVFVLVPMICIGQEEKPVVPASQEDVQKLQAEIQRLRREAQTAEKNSVVRSEAEKQERRKISEANNATIIAAETNLKIKLEAIAREAQKASDDQLRTQRIAWSVTGGAVLVGTLTLIFLWTRKSRKKEIVAPITQRKQEDKKPEILKDPDIPTLKEFSQRNNGIGKIPFILSLRDGRQFNCVAELRDGLDPLVYIEREKIPVAWDKRRERAIKIAVPHAIA